MSRFRHNLWALALFAGVAGHAAARPALAASLSGSVTLAPGGEPSRGVWVSALRLGDYMTYSGDDNARPRGRERFAVTDERGTFSFRDLTPGEYEVSLRVDSLPPTLAPESKPVHTVLVSDKDAATVDLSLTRFATFDGMARRQGAGAVTGVRVQAFHHGDTRPFAETWTDNHGAFHIAGLERNVPIDLMASTSEGQYCRITKTPLKAGAQPAEIVLPPWSATTKRRVEVTVILPTGGERRYELDWISKPEGAPTGYRTTISLDRDGRGELDSPEGVFLVRVRESGGGAAERSWTAARFYRVDASGTGPVSARVDLNPEPNPEPHPDPNPEP